MSTKSIPSDTNQIAASILDRAISIGHANDMPVKIEKDPAAVALGRRGGLKGGKARAEKLTAARRKEIAKKAAKSRWKKRP